MQGWQQARKVIDPRRGQGEQFMSASPDARQLRGAHLAA